MMKMPRLDGQPVNLFPTRAGLLATLSGVCLALLWAATTLLPIHMPPFYFWLQDVLAAVFALGVLAPLLHSQTLRPSARLLVIPVGLVLLAVLSLPRGHLGATLLFCGALLWASALYAAAQPVRARIMDWLAGALVVSAVLGALIGLRQVVAWHAPFAVGALAQRNLYADAQTLGLIVILFLPVARTWRGALAALVALSIAASGSAAAILYAVWLLAFGAWHRSKRLAVGGLGLLGVILLWRLASHSLGHASHTPSASLFVALWRPALAEIAHHPLGLGLGQTVQFYYHLAARLPDTPAFAALHTEVFASTHNFFLQAGLNFGLPGMVLIFCLLVVFLRRARQPEHLLPSALLGVLWLHSMVEFPLWQMGFLGLFAVLYGATTPALPRCSRRQMGSLPLVVIGFSALGLALLVGLAVQMRDIDAAFVPAKSPLADARNTAALQAWAAGHSPSALALRDMNALALARKSPLLIVVPTTWPAEKRILDRAFSCYPMGSIPLERATVWALTKSAPPAQLDRLAHAAICARPDDARKFDPVLRRFAARLPRLAPVVAAWASPCS